VEEKDVVNFKTQVISLDFNYQKLVTCSFSSFIYPGSERKMMFPDVVKITKRAELPNKIP
jgi:hypothetical protein